MLDRVLRIVRANVGHLRRRIGDRWRGDPPEQRYDDPEPRPAPPPETPPDDVRRAFAALELPLDADAERIRQAWRRLLSRYHPDRHATDPDRESVATELTRRLTDAYQRAVDYRRSHPVSPERP
jgi:DnaJ-domain-containing protein 1